MRTVLIISRYFPPRFDVGGKRAWRFARYLPAHGWRPVVMTSKEPPEDRRDPTPLNLPAEALVFRDYMPHDHQDTARMSEPTSARPVRKRREGRKIVWPVDGEARLAIAAGFRAARHAREVGADVIFATSSPYSVLLAGTIAAALTRLPLVLDLRDPWSLNYLSANRPNWARRLDAGVEHHFFRRADKVLLTCASAANAYRARYPDLPAGHIQSITNSFDPVFAPAGASPRPQKVRLLHFGSVYGKRTLRPVLEAIASLPDEVRDGLELLNLGRVSEEDVALAASLGVSEQLRWRGAVPYAEGVELLAAADLQVLLAYGDETLFLPAKLFDYLMTGAPILCVSEPSELTEIIEETRAGRWARATDVVGVASIIRAAVDARRTGTPLTNPETSAISRYAAPATTRALARVLDEVCGPPGT